MTETSANTSLLLPGKFLDWGFPPSMGAPPGLESLSQGEAGDESIVPRPENPVVARVPGDFPHHVHSLTHSVRKSSYPCIPKVNCPQYHLISS